MVTEMVCRFPQGYPVIHFTPRCLSHTATNNMWLCRPILFQSNSQVALNAGAVDKKTARQFLNAREWDMTKAMAMLHDNLRWKKEFGCPVDPKTCLGELIKGKVSP